VLCAANTGPALGMFKVFGRTGPPSLWGAAILAVLTKEPEMLQPDAFCEHTMQQNATAADAPSRTPLGSSQHSPDPLAGFKGPLRGGEGEGKGKGGEGQGGGEGEGGEVDSDAQLEWAADWLRPAVFQY